MIATAAAPAAIALRDIHEPLAPGWWPPAPGWWLLAAIVLLLALAWLARRWWRRRRQRDMANLFDRSVAAAATPAARIAAMSELLRRASRLRDPAADRLQGEDWLAFLDQDTDGKRTGTGTDTAFSQGPGRALLDAAFRRDAGDVDIEALHALARARFVSWTAPQ